MKHLHIFVEEPSIALVLNKILPKVIPGNTNFRVYAHQGKQDLERALKTTAPSISKTPGARIIISRDQDAEDCVAVKEKLHELVVNKIRCPFKIRIVCKELESWFLGDLNAVESAYPRFRSELILNRAELLNVDLITKPSSKLLAIIPNYQKREYLPKIETAERIAPFLDVDNNKSTSFNNMLKAIKELVKNDG